MIVKMLEELIATVDDKELKEKLSIQLNRAKVLQKARDEGRI